MSYSRRGWQINSSLNLCTRAVSQWPQPQWFRRKQTAESEAEFGGSAYRAGPGFNIFVFTIRAFQKRR
eukprot:1041014-Rhodomonas_salina.2